MSIEKILEIKGNLHTQKMFVHLFKFDFFFIPFVAQYANEEIDHEKVYNKNIYNCRSVSVF